jgi:hypothetical protein
MSKVDVSHEMAILLTGGLSQNRRNFERQDKMIGQWQTVLQGAANSAGITPPKITVGVWGQEK